MEDAQAAPEVDPEVVSLDTAFIPSRTQLFVASFSVAVLLLAGWSSLCSDCGRDLTLI